MEHICARVKYEIVVRILVEVTIIGTGLYTNWCEKKETLSCNFFYISQQSFYGS